MQSGARDSSPPSSSPSLAKWLSVEPLGSVVDEQRGQVAQMGIAAPAFGSFSAFIMVSSIAERLRIAPIFKNSSCAMVPFSSASASEINVWVSSSFGS